MDTVDIAITVCVVIGLIVALYGVLLVMINAGGPPKPGE